MIRPSRPPLRGGRQSRLLGVALGLMAGLAGSAPPAGVDQAGITSPLGWAPALIAASQIAPKPAPGVRYLETRSDRAISLGLEGLDHAHVTADPGRYRLSSPTDPHYREPLGATGAGSDQQVVGLKGNRQPLIEARLHPLFPYPLQPGQDYRLDISSAQGADGRPLGPALAAIPVSYHPERISGSIQVNQVGYASHAQKFAYLGNWLGTLGPLPLDAAQFEVIAVDTGKAIFTGEARLRARADPWSGNDVYEADFSALTRPGRFRLRVPGLGISHDFVIGPEVYEPVYRTVMRLFYASRNGIPILAPWADAGYERPAGGVLSRLDGVFHANVGTSPLGRGEAPGGRHPVSRGWFDAGDFGQYVVNAGPVWYQIGAALDIAPGNFRDGDLGIPESGNGLPDVLDELEWGMDWLLTMQDTEDGGVYSRIASATWDSVPPYRIDQPRLIFEKTTHATAVFAAAAAIHSRLLRDYRPERAATVLKAAEAAWDYLQSHPQWPAEGDRYQNPKGIHAGDYADSSAQDNLLWASAELYRTTGRQSYGEAYRRRAQDLKVDVTSNISFKDQGLAALWAYLMTADSSSDPVLYQQARGAFLAAADWRIREGEAHPFRAPTHHAIQWAGWGSFGRSTAATLPLLQAYHLTGKDSYRDWAWLTPNPQLGANPQGISYITGLGALSPRFPLSLLSKLDDVAEPLRGIPVHGPHYHLPALWAEMRAVNEGYFPPEKPSSPQPKDARDYADAYPVLRRYTDSDALPPMSEPTIAEYAQVGVAYGLLRDEGLGWSEKGEATRSAGR